MDKISLTMEESRLWTEWKLNPNDCNHNLILQYKLTGTLDIKRLNRALTITQTTFDKLRAFFIEEDGVPYRAISPPNEFEIEITDLTQSKYEGDNLEAVANQQRIQLLKKPFVLTKPPLYFCKLIKYTFERYYFIFSIHPILCDAYSLNLFLNLLSQLYNHEEDLQEIVNQYTRQPSLIELPHSKRKAKTKDTVAAENY